MMIDGTRNEESLAQWRYMDARQKSKVTFLEAVFLGNAFLSLGFINSQCHRIGWVMLCFSKPYNVQTVLSVCFIWFFVLSLLSCLLIVMPLVRYGYSWIKSQPIYKLETISKTLDQLLTPVPFTNLQRVIMTM